MSISCERDVPYPASAELVRAPSVALRRPRFIRFARPFVLLGVVLALTACVRGTAVDSDVDSVSDSAIGDDGASGLDIPSDTSDIAKDVGPEATSETDGSATDCSALDCAEDEDCVTSGGEATCQSKCTAPQVWDPDKVLCVEPADCTACIDASRTCDDSSGLAVCGECIAATYDDGGICRPAGSCEPGASDSIIDECASQHRTCVPPAAGEPASCGACAPGFADKPGQPACVPSGGCGAQGTCADGQVCLQLGSDNDAANCMDAPCAEGSAWDRTDGECRTCGVCTGEGATGSVWPVTDQSGNCICETEEGYFWDPAVAATQAVACDKDGDGWTNEKVAQLLSQVSQNDGAAGDDLGLLLNIRCDIKAIDGVVMVNEQGQTKTLTLKDLGSDAGTLALFETSRNDRGDSTDAMPAHGRTFLPQEANSLTKVCAANVDLNDNGISDALEGQDYDGGSGFQQVFNRFAYFTELYAGSLIDGKWHIVERSRCETAFAIGYAPDADPNWRSCHRRRPSGFSGNDEALGTDFGRFDCDEANGSCDLAATVQPVAAGTPTPAHGVCDSIQLPPDTPWRGMTHYSQFACVTVRNTSSPVLGEVALDDIRPDEAWVANTCVLSDDTDTVDCQAITTDAAADTAVDTVVWAAKTFAAYDVPNDYDGGCIDEGADWPHLCPGIATDPVVAADGDEAAFGLLTCDCQSGYSYDNDICVDVIECANPALFVCDPDATCFNTVGGYGCTCNAGYEGDGFTCADVDECTLEIDTCYNGYAGTCTNTVGGFQCQCPELFPGDGETCEEPTVDGLVAYHPAQGQLDGSATVVDESGNGNDGSVKFNTVLLPVEDRFDDPGGAWFVDGVFSGNTVIFMADPPPSFTVVFWAQNINSFTNNRIFKMGLPEVWVGDTQNPNCALMIRKDLTSAEDGPWCHTFTEDDDTWLFLAITYQGGNRQLSLWVGRPGPEPSQPVLSVESGSLPLENQFGADLTPDEFKFFHNGQLDDIRVYDRVLTEHELEQLHHEHGFRL